MNGTGPFQGCLRISVNKGSGQDVVQENWILKKNDFFFLNEISFLFFFFFEKNKFPFFLTRYDPLNNHFGKS